MLGMHSWLGGTCCSFSWFCLECSSWLTVHFQMTAVTSSYCYYFAFVFGHLRSLSSPTVEGRKKVVVVNSNDEIADTRLTWCHLNFQTRVICNNKLNIKDLTDTIALNWLISYHLLMSRAYYSKEKRESRKIKYRHFLPMFNSSTKEDGKAADE